MPWPNGLFEHLNKKSVISVSLTVGNDLGNLGSIPGRCRDIATVFRPVLRSFQPSNPVEPKSFCGDKVKNMYK
jgi:hypothetical protein